MFLSKEYAERLWTSFERRSATARAIQDKGNDYILPVRIDDTDIDGLPNTLGYIPVEKYSAKEIAALLVKKIKGR